MTFTDVPAWPDPQTAPPAALCDCCGGEIYGGETAYLIDSFAVCEDCFGDFTSDYFARCRMRGTEIREALKRNDTL